MAGQTYYPAIPAIAQAYVNDPRTKLALQAQQAGASTDPVAGGKWAWASGLARAGSGIVGAIESKQQQRQYDDKQQQVMNEVAAALGGGGAAGPQQGGVGVGPAAGGTQAQPPVAPPVPPQVQNNPPPVAPPMAPPQAPPQAPPAPPAGLPPPGGPPLSGGAPIHPATPQIAAALGGGGAATSATPFPASFPSVPAPATSTGTPATKVTGASLVQAMLPITAQSESNGQDFKGGKPVTSAKGAQYAMQVMPATARKPGFGIAPAKDDSPQEYNRVGTELLGKLTDKYGGDPAKAWAAYNCGTGRVDHALAAAQKNGGDWLSKLPQETQAYVAKNCAALGTGAPAGGTQQAAAEPEYQIPGQVPLPATNAPGVPDLPNAPADRGSAHSLALDAGRKLINAKDPFLYEQAMEMLNKGMGEQFGADQKALDVLNNRDNTLYSAGIDDHFNAAQAQRNDAYSTGREMRGYAHDDNTLHETQAFNRSEDASKDAFTARENQKNRDAEMERTKYTVDGKRLTAQEQRDAKRTQFFQTPQGAKMYGDASDAINNNNGLAGLVDQFMQENDKSQNTGGFVNNTPYVAGAERILNGHMQTMDSISHQLAPMIRQKGQGSMSDRDLEMFERAVPSTKSNYQTNQTRAAQFKQYVNRMNDFETHKLQAAADGSNVDFLRSWNTYKNSVPVSSGKSYEDWIASIPHYDAQGNKK